jgi:hypothetical protein
VKEDPAAAETAVQVSSDPVIQISPQQEVDSETVSHSTPMENSSLPILQQSPLVPSESFKTPSTASLSNTTPISSQARVVISADAQSYNRPTPYSDALTQTLNQRERGHNQEQQVQIQAFPAFRNSDPEGVPLWLDSALLIFSVLLGGIVIHRVMF